MNIIEAKNGFIYLPLSISDVLSNYIIPILYQKIIDHQIYNKFHQPVLLHPNLLTKNYICLFLRKLTVSTLCLS